MKMTPIYYLAITNDNGKLSGHISNKSFDDDLNCFNPLTVFGDMLNTAVENGSFKETYKKHPFFQNKMLRRKIDEYIERRKTDKFLHPSDPFCYDFILLSKFLASCGRIYECLKSQDNISLSEFELIKAMNEFKFTFEICDGERIENVADMLPDSYEKHRYISVDFGLYNTAELWNEYRNETKNPIRFAYTCNSIEEVLFATWHYLVFNDFKKFNQCHHCEKFFAATSLKVKYCNDYSPYEKYTHLSCEQAVRNIKQKLARRKNNIAYHLQIWYSDKTFHEFLDEYDKLDELIKERSTVENLKILEHFLDKETVKETWYSDENKELAKMMP